MKYILFFILSIQSVLSGYAPSSSLDIPNYVVRRDSSGNFSTNAINTDFLGVGLASPPTRPLDILLPADNNILIDGATNPRTVTPGAIRQEHRAGVSGTTARYFNMFPNTFDDTKAINTYFNFEGSTSAISAVGNNIQIAPNGATNFNFTGMFLSVVGDLDPLNIVDAIGTAGGVRPIHQDIGGVVNAEAAWSATSVPVYTDTTTAFGSAVTNVQIFSVDDGYIFVGHSLKFSVISVDLAIIGSTTIQDITNYWNGSAWTTLTKTDGTNGFTQDGNISFTPPTDWATSAVNGVTKYWVRIQRTRNTMSPPPTENTIRVTVPTEYVWDAEGGLSVATINTSGRGEIGFPGFEESGVNINGTVMTDKFRINDFGVTDPEQLVLHRHSTVNPPNLVGAYTNNDTTSHSAVVLGQDILSIDSVAYTGSHYDYFGRIQFETDSSGTISSTSSPGNISFWTVPNTTNTLTQRMVIKSDGKIGIGTSSPSQGLEVNGNIRQGVTGGVSIGSDAGRNRFVGYTTGPRIRFLDTTDNYANIGAGSISMGATYSGTSAPTSGAIIEGAVGIGTLAPNANALLDVSSTTKAFMPPRMTTAQKNAIASPTAGMVVYDSTLNKLCVYTGAAWQTITSAP